MGEDEYTWIDAAAAATRMLRNDVSDAEIRDLLPDEMEERAFELARLRKRAAERFEDPWELFFDPQGLRYATPDTVAAARADRLAGHGDRVVDVACGAGIQLAFLADRFEEAVGIEIDPDRAELARRNLEAYGVEADIVVGDCLDPTVRSTVGDVDVVVCDPARDPEADQRRFEDLTPRLEQVHERWTADAQAFCYELPPMMPPERVRAQFEGETEYTSLNDDLNRLALYGADAHAVDRSALTLPSGERLTDEDPAMDVEPTDEAQACVYLADRTVLAAGLLDRLAHRVGTGALLSEDHPRRTLLTGPEPAASAFVRSFEVLGIHDWNLLGLHHKLQRLGAGTVTLRASIDPDRYWEVRNALEDGLEGERSIDLFRVGEKGLIVEPVDDRERSDSGQTR